MNYIFRQRKSQYQVSLYFLLLIISFQILFNNRHYLNNETLQYAFNLTEITADLFYIKLCCTFINSEFIINLIYILKCLSYSGSVYTLSLFYKAWSRSYCSAMCYSIVNNVLIIFLYHNLFYIFFNSFLYIWR